MEREKVKDWIHFQVKRNYSKTQEKCDILININWKEGRC
jgi:hypothetical protein